jgi:hypothetical protein
VRKGSPIQIKLDKRKPCHDPDKWNQAVWVKMIGTYGHSYRGKGATRKTALNQEDDKNFDLVLSPYGTILRPTRTDRMITQEVDKNGKMIMILGPKRMTRSLKMIIGDPLNNPIPREFKYESPNSNRVKMIRIMYEGQPWFCRPCQTHHLLRFCPEDKRKFTFGKEQSPAGQFESKPRTILLSASETKLFDPTTTDVKIVQWSGGRIGHKANMMDDEGLEEVDHVIVVCGINDISMDTKETKESSKHHIMKLYNALKATKPKRTTIFGPYTCPEQAGYVDAKRIINSRLKRMADKLQDENNKTFFHAIPDDLLQEETDFEPSDYFHLNQQVTDKLIGLFNEKSDLGMEGTKALPSGAKSKGFRANP